METHNQPQETGPIAEPLVTTPIATEADVVPALPQKPISKMVHVEKFLTPVAIILGSLIISGTFIAVQPKINAAAQPAAVANAAAAPTVDANKIATNGEPFIGKSDAPVTIAYWTDFQCPFCKQLEINTLPGVVQNYVNSGKVKVVFKDFQFLGNDSTIAALTARAVWDLYPSQYFAWREAMYQKQDAENSGFGDRASITALTKTISGIDTTKVFAAVDSKKDQYQKAIDADRDEGSKLGVQGTPALVVGNSLVPGVITYADLSTLIQKELAK